MTYMSEEDQVAFEGRAKSVEESGEPWLIVTYPEAWQGTKKAEDLHEKLSHQWRRFSAMPGDVDKVTYRFIPDPGVPVLSAELVARRDRIPVVLLIVAALQILTLVLLAIMLTGCSRRETPAQTDTTTVSNEAAKQEEGETWKGANTTTMPSSKSSASTSTLSEDVSQLRSIATTAATRGSNSSTPSRGTVRAGASPIRVAAAITFEAATSPAVERCIEYVKGRPFPPPCIPPQTYRAPNAKPPFDVLYRYGYEGKIAGQATFIWLKASEPSRPCTAAERANGAAYKLGCSAKIGDPLVELPQFRELPRMQSLMSESAAVGTPMPAIRRVDDLDMFATIKGDRYCRVGTNLAACVGRRRYFLVAIQVADMLRGADAASTRDDVRLDAGRLSKAERIEPWWPESHAVNSWMVVPVENDSKGDQFVQLAVTGGRLLTPIMRIRDLQPISVGDLK